MSRARKGSAAADEGEEAVPAAGMALPAPMRKPLIAWVFGYESLWRLPLADDGEYDAPMRSHGEARRGSEKALPWVLMVWLTRLAAGGILLVGWEMLRAAKQRWWRRPGDTKRAAEASNPQGGS